MQYLRLHGSTIQGRYDEKANQALFVVTTTGTVLARPPRPIDEDDEILVSVIGPASELENIQIKQTSAYRDANALSILGDAVAISSPLVHNQGASDYTITTKPLSAGNGFAPGRGTIELSRVSEGQVQSSSFDFVVNTLYAGAFSFGPAYTKLMDNTYGYTVTGKDTTLTVTDQGSPRIHYVLGYTPFIWGSRDVAKLNTLQWYKHINPTIAITVKNTFDNAFVGITGDLFRNSAYFTVGQHIGKVTRLDPNSGLEVGKHFSPAKRTIPTVQSWENDWFFSVTIDLRAALRFFNAALASAPH